MDWSTKLAVVKGKDRRQAMIKVDQYEQQEGDNPSQQAGNTGPSIQEIPKADS